jgi:hypothetical protein
MFPAFHMLAYRSVNICMILDGIYALLNLATEGRNEGTNKQEIAFQRLQHKFEIGDNL